MNTQRHFETHTSQVYTRWVLQHMLVWRGEVWVIKDWLQTASHHCSLPEGLQVLWHRSRVGPSGGQWLGITRSNWAGNGNTNQCSIVWLTLPRNLIGKAPIQRGLLWMRLNLQVFGCKALDWFMRQTWMSGANFMSVTPNIFSSEPQIPISCWHYRKVHFLLLFL